jgi:hypothetical protein
MPISAVDPLFCGQRIHIRIDRLLKAIALVVIGLPLCRVEKLVGIKAETVKAKLLSLLDASGWESLDFVLEQRFKIPSPYRCDFHSVIVVARELDTADFSEWAKTPRYLTARDRAACVRLASRILGRSLSISDIRWQRKRS